MCVGGWWQEHNHATAAEANECVSILEEQLQLTMKTKGDEIVALQVRAYKLEDICPRRAFTSSQQSVFRESSVQSE